MSYEPKEASADAPDTVKTLQWALKVARLYWRWIVRPPVLAVIVIVGLLSYRFGSSVEASRVQAKDDLITTKQGLVEFLTAELNAYKDRLHGATPDEAARKFASLEAQVDRQKARLDVISPEKYRHLTSLQKKSLAKNREQLRSAAPKGGSIMIFFEPVGDNGNYAQEIMDFIDKDRQFLAGPFTGGSCAEDEHDIVITVNDPSDPPPTAKTVLQVLSDAGLKPSYGTMRDNVPFQVIFCRARP